MDEGMGTGGEGRTTAPKRASISACQKVAKSSVVLCWVSPVSLMPMNQATRVSSAGCGTTSEAYVAHCLTSSTRSTVKLWCSGSLGWYEHGGGARKAESHRSLLMSAPAKAKFQSWRGAHWEGFPEKQPVRNSVYVQRQDAGSSSTCKR